ncbi:hypothetical protein LguiB_017972 [Lonicera macranthoides]
MYAQLRANVLLHQPIWRTAQLIKNSTPQDNKETPELTRYPCSAGLILNNPLYSQTFTDFINHKSHRLTKLELHKPPAKVSTSYAYSPPICIAQTGSQRITHQVVTQAKDKDAAHSTPRRQHNNAKELIMVSQYSKNDLSTEIILDRVKLALRYSRCIALHERLPLCPQLQIGSHANNLNSC